MRKNKLLILISLTICMLFTGCTQKERLVTSQEILLIDPVNATSNLETVYERNLYDVNVYSATVFPEMIEYFFEKSIHFLSYGAFPGEYGSKNDILMYSNMEQLDKQIEELAEKIQLQKEEFNEYKTEIIENLVETLEEEKRLEKRVKTYESKIHVRVDDIG